MSSKFGILYISSASGIGSESKIVCLFRSRKSIQNRLVPSFLGTMTIGEQNGDLEGSMISNFNISFTSLLTVSSNENGMERFLTYWLFAYHSDVMFQNICYTWFIH